MHSENCGRGVQQLQDVRSVQRSGKVLGVSVELSILEQLCHRVKYLAMLKENKEIEMWDTRGKGHRLTLSTRPAVCHSRRASTFDHIVETDSNLLCVLLDLDDDVGVFEVHFL